MRLIVTNVFCGLFVLGLFAGCNQPKGVDDGSGPRAAPSGMTKGNPKAPDKPAMGGKTLPPQMPPIPPKDKRDKGEPIKSGS